MQQRHGGGHSNKGAGGECGDESNSFFMKEVSSGSSSWAETHKNHGMAVSRLLGVDSGRAAQHCHGDVGSCPSVQPKGACLCVVILCCSEVSGGVFVRSNLVL